jgi:hypothetical protein
MGHYDDDPSESELEMRKIGTIAAEYRYITDNYEALNTKLADINVYQLLQILEKLEGARKRAAWSRM